jgi:hypothetical protein
MRLLYVLFFVLGWVASPALAVTIAIQDFETTPASPTLTFTNTGGAFYTGNSAAGDRPASSPFASSPTRAFGVSNNTTTLTFPQAGGINLCAYENISLSFRLASFSIGSTGNGADLLDSVIVAISPDGGTTWYNQIIVKGNNNAWWSYTAGTATASRAYSTAAATAFAPAGGGSRTTDGYSTVRVTNLPAVPSLRIRITLFNNAANERWVIDDVLLEGDLAVSPGLNVCPNTPITGLNYLLGTGPSAAQAFTVFGSGLSPLAGNITITAPANFEIASNPAGPYSGSILAPYTGGNLASTTYYIRLISGLGLGNYSASLNLSGGGGSPINLEVSGTVRQELFFSEYVEGSSNNKYIEVFNPTGSAINLSGYNIRRYNNGASTPTATYSFPNINLGSCQSFTIRNTSASLPLTADVISNVPTDFSGDDALELFNTTLNQTIDIFGRIGEDPGAAWTAPGGFSTVNKTLVRRPEVQVGVLQNPASGFPTLGTEWIQYDIDEYRLLGNHSAISCGNTIETLPLTAPAPYCAGEVLPVSFAALGTFNAGNQFRVQLSDANGLFGSPTLLTGALALSGTDPSGTVNAIIPTVATSSNNYRVRVISTNPAGQTIINPPSGFTLSAASALENVSDTSYDNVSGEVTLTWTNPSGCFDEIMIVVTAAPGISFAPTGNGLLYTANPVFGGFNQVVYKGDGTSATISNLTDGVVYYFEIFTRLGMTWSSGIEIGAIPDQYCIPTITEACDEYIYNIQLNTINNTTAEGCGFNGYSSFINQSTTLVKGETYTLNVGVGIVGEGIDISYFNDDIRVWIDYNQSGVLQNTVLERIVNH